MTNPLTIILTILVYDNSNIGSSLVAYIFHNVVISLVLCDYEVHMTLNFDFERKSTFNMARHK